MTVQSRADALRDLTSTLESSANQAKALSEHTVFYLVQMAINDLHEEERLAGFPSPRPIHARECAVFRFVPRR